MRLLVAHSRQLALGTKFVPTISKFQHVIDAFCFRDYAVVF